MKGKEMNDFRHIFQAIMVTMLGLTLVVTTINAGDAEKSAAKSAQAKLDQAKQAINDTKTKIVATVTDLKAQATALQQKITQAKSDANKNVQLAVQLAQTFITDAKSAGKKFQDSATTGPDKIDSDATAAQINASADALSSAAQDLSRVELPRDITN